MENKELILEPYGDTELWYASGADWSFPLHVQWHIDKENSKHYGLVMTAVSPYYSQGLMLNSLLQVHDIQGRQSCWMIPRNLIEAILHKAPGITELAYYKWPEENTPAIPIPKSVKISKSGEITTELVTHNSDMSNQEQFVTFLSEKSGLNKSVIKVVIKAICDHAAYWMIYRRKEINFGMFKIFAAPFRPNWKEIVSFKFKRWKLLEMFNSGNGEKFERLEAAGIQGAFCSMHNVAIKKEGNRHRITYSLEAVTTQRFEKVVDEVERKRLASGGTSYVASFEKTVEALYLHLLDALESYLRKTGMPFARLSESRHGGLVRFVPTESNKIKVHGIPIRDLPVCVIPPRSNFSLTDGDLDSQIVPIPPPGVPEMSGVLQTDENVRECKGDSDVEHDDGERAPRLSLLVPSQGKNEEESVLAGREIANGDASGLE